MAEHPSLFVAVTDYDWYQLHASKDSVDEVNFWRPSSSANFKALDQGGLFLFKLHSPLNFIVGGGFFAKFLQIPLSLAWESFGDANGTRTIEEMRSHISKYRQVKISPGDDPSIGCIILAEPFFFPKPDWIPAPPDFATNIVAGKRYRTDTESGHHLWHEVVQRLQIHRQRSASAGPALVAAAEARRYGGPAMVMPRLGQGAFRLLVTDAYSRRCAMTNERTLPVLEAAHIRPYATGGKHELSNGLLLRSDLHRLFDHGYITVDPEEQCIVVSKRIREEFENGRDYYQLHGRRIASPSDQLAHPSQESLRFHAETVFR